MTPAMSDGRQGEFDLFSHRSGRGYRDVARAFEPARLTQARVLAELTKAELADAIHVSAAAVGQYEAGAAAPRPELLPVLARELKVPVEFFAAGRPLGRLDAANAHFRSLRSTRAKDRAKAATHAEQIWELTHALEKRVRLPEIKLPEVPEGASPTDGAQILRQAWGVGSPNLTGVPPGRLPPLEQPEPAGRYGARASARTLATVRDGRRVVPRRAWRAARVVAMRTRRVWLPGLANPRAFLATSFAVRLCASAFAFE